MQFYDQQIQAVFYHERINAWFQEFGPDCDGVDFGIVPWPGRFLSAGQKILSGFVSAGEKLHNTL